MGKDTLMGGRYERWVGREGGREEGRGIQEGKRVNICVGKDCC
jgi:hypothetical protein